MNDTEDESSVKYLEIMKYFNWVHLVVGLWVLASPWILGFAGITTALWSNVIAGILVVIFAIWEIFGGKSQMGTA